MKTIQDWQKESHTLANDKGWWDDVKRHPADELDTSMITVTDIASKLALIHSEVSEALSEIRDGNAPTLIYNHPGSGKPEGFGIELADTVIRIMDLCGALNIDLSECMDVKHKFNKTRSRRHGGKAL